MAGWTYDSGQFNLYCDICKKKIKSGEAKHRWDGFITCPDDWEPRQPQDFVKAKIDKISVPFSRPVEQTNSPVNYGVFDIIPLNETVDISKDYRAFLQDSLKLNEVFAITKYFYIIDYLEITEQLSYDTTGSLEFNEVITLSEAGWLYSYDYTTPPPPDPNTYFLEEYVGLLQNFT